MWSRRGWSGHCVPVADVLLFTEAQGPLADPDTNRVDRLPLAHALKLQTGVVRISTPEGIRSRGLVLHRGWQTPSVGESPSSDWTSWSRIRRRKHPFQRLGRPRRDGVTNIGREVIPPFVGRCREASLPGRIIGEFGQEPTRNRILLGSW